MTSESDTRHLDKCDLPDAKLFLYSAIGTKVFSSCENFGELLEKLQQDHKLMFHSTKFPFSNNSWLVLTRAN